MSHAPADEYRARLSARRAAHMTLTRSDERLSYGRLAVFAAGAVVLVAAWRGWIPPWWVALPGVAFLILVVRHDRIIRSRDAAARAIALYERGLSRIEDRWAGGGEQGERFSNAEHLYATDLDLFGPASLFELLSSARTRAGEETLAAWLLAPADIAEVTDRQAAVADLTDRLDLREAISLAGSDIRAGVHTGEVELEGDDVRGLAVHIGSRVAALAGAGEVLVSSTVRDLSVGSDIQFVDRGTRPLKGVPGEWQLFAARAD